jgi:hypothetical protein
MPNINPIHLNEQEVQTDYVIPAVYADKDLTLTLEVELNAEDWTYRPDCIIMLNGHNIYLAGHPLPTNLPLGNAVNLKNKLLYVDTEISRIYTPGGFSGSVPKVTYKMTIKSNDDIIDSFSKQSGSENPSRFRSLTKFI